MKKKLKERIGAVIKTILKQNYVKRTNYDILIKNYDGIIYNNLLYGHEHNYDQALEFAQKKLKEYSKKYKKCIMIFEVLDIVVNEAHEFKMEK